MSSYIEIIIGTYEEFLLGYKLDINDKNPSLSQSFADKSHTGSIRCVAVHGNWLASGGNDDRIFIYDMSSRKQSQILLHHEGTINSLSFTPDGTHLLSGGEDGCMIVTRVKTWCADAVWKKSHNGKSVTHISCHPSGKLALSLGSDLILRTWNLVKGRVAYKTNLKSRNTLGSQPNCLVWSPSGDYFAITGQSIVEIWSIKNADVLRTHKTKSKPVCLTWMTNNVCLAGLEDGQILWIFSDKEEEKEIVAHNTRVKALCAFKEYLVSASSSGEIKVWKVMEKKRKLHEVAKTSIGCRPTCINILDLEQFGQNYIISSTLPVKENERGTQCTKATAPKRGVVTLEYEEGDENEYSKRECTESDDKIVSEVDIDLDSIDESDENRTKEDSDEKNSEREIELPKSRKREIKNVSMQQHKTKKGKYIQNKQ